MRKRYSQALKRKRKREKKEKNGKMEKPQKWTYPAEDSYGIGIGKTNSIIGETLVAVVVWNKKIRLYERCTYSHPRALSWMPEDDNVLQKYKTAVIADAEKCRKETYSLGGVDFPIEVPTDSRDQGLEAALLENLVVILGQEPTTDWMALCQKVTAEQFEAAIKEFETEWTIFSFEDWGK